MAEYTVYFSSGASAWVNKIQAEDADEAIDKACNEVHVTLCHQCAREVDLSGDWEPEAVINEDTGKIEWEARL